MAIKCWYAAGGSLVTDDPIEGITGNLKSNQDFVRFYGGHPYLIAESMTRSAAERIAAALGLDFQQEEHNDGSH
jgi:hypothetical protein